MYDVEHSLAITSFVLFGILKNIIANSNKVNL